MIVPLALAAMLLAACAPEEQDAEVGADPADASEADSDPADTSEEVPPESDDDESGPDDGQDMIDDLELPIADLCELLTASEVQDYAERLSREGAVEELREDVVEVLEGEPSLETSPGHARARCHWPVVTSLTPSDSVVLFPDPECNEDFSRCERDITMTLTVSIADEETIASLESSEGPDGMPEADEVPGYEGRSSVLGVQGDLWTIEEDLLLSLHIGQGISGVPGSPELMAEMLSDAAARMTELW